MKYLFRKDKTAILSERVEGKQDYYKSFMAFFHRWGWIASWLVEPLRGDSLLFHTKFPEIPDTH